VRKEVNNDIKVKKRVSDREEKVNKTVKVKDNKLYTKRDKEKRKKDRYKSKTKRRTDKKERQI
jgi:hypothetical protein